MPMNIGITGFILIALLALLLFGPSKLPQLGKAIGTTIREFRSGTKEWIESDDSKTEKDDK
ncbi:twin-arginine translocase TatA/TatE family subunit [Paenibacillus sp. OV219]|uniref:twin-arginine translocase TatA/TatE family subunit n=1 Tax=Paenibacillus sp. OV219 TaxID=1884377 RepID=UPI0008BCEB7E|nr:twin-arginine translocase TatA/TatE family subunit [Paenibacillus sp. OV219]SEN97102.1 sec-independent protein translocase protein TatA [Paenibacillus sp. OV219]